VAPIATTLATAEIADAVEENYNEKTMDEAVEILATAARR